MEATATVQNGAGWMRDNVREIIIGLLCAVVLALGGWVFRTNATVREVQVRQELHGQQAAHAAALKTLAEVSSIMSGHTAKLTALESGQQSVASEVRDQRLLLQQVLQRLPSAPSPWPLGQPPRGREVR